MSGGAPQRLSGDIGYDGCGQQGGGRIVLPAWFFPTFVVVIAGLLYAVWRVWRAEIRVWLIPHSQIRQAAEDLVRLHGAGNAERTALTYSLKAWDRRDITEAGRWDRVAHWLRRNTKKELARK